MLCYITSCTVNNWHQLFVFYSEHYLLTCQWCVSVEIELSAAVLQRLSLIQLEVLWSTVFVLFTLYFAAPWSRVLRCTLWHREAVWVVCYIVLCGTMKPCVTLYFVAPWSRVCCVLHCTLWHREAVCYVVLCGTVKPCVLCVTLYFVAPWSHVLRCTLWHLEAVCFVCYVVLCGTVKPCVTLYFAAPWSRVCCVLHCTLWHHEAMCYVVLCGTVKPHVLCVTLYFVAPWSRVCHVLRYTLRHHKTCVSCVVQCQWSDNEERVSALFVSTERKSSRCGAVYCISQCYQNSSKIQRPSVRHHRNPWSCHAGCTEVHSGDHGELCVKQLPSSHCKLAQLSRGHCSS